MPSHPSYGALSNERSVKSCNILLVRASYSIYTQTDAKNASVSIV